jgi:hypothetical protein
MIMAGEMAVRIHSLHAPLLVIWAISISILERALLAKKAGLAGKAPP